MPNPYDDILAGLPGRSPSPSLPSVPRQSNPYADILSDLGTEPRPESPSLFDKFKSGYETAQQFIGGPKEALDTLAGMGAEYLQGKGVNLGIDPTKGNEAGQLVRKVNPFLGGLEAYNRSVFDLLPDAVGKPLAGAQEGALEKASALVTDPMMYALPQSKLVAGAFLPGIVQGAGEQIGQAGAAFEQGDYGEAARLGAGGLVDAGFGILGGLHAARRAPLPIERALAEREAVPAETPVDPLAVRDDALWQRADESQLRLAQEEANQALLDRIQRDMDERANLALRVQEARMQGLQAPPPDLGELVQPSTVRGQAPPVDVSPPVSPSLPENAAVASLEPPGGVKPPETPPTPSAAPAVPPVEPSATIPERPVETPAPVSATPPEPGFTANREGYGPETAHAVRTLIEASRKAGRPVETDALGSEIAEGPNGETLIGHGNAGIVIQDGVIHDFGAERPGSINGAAAVISAFERGARPPSFDKMSPDSLKLAQKMAADLGVKVEDIGTVDPRAILTGENRLARARDIIVRRRQRVPSGDVGRAEGGNPPPEAGPSPADLTAGSEGTGGPRGAPVEAARPTPEAPAEEPAELAGGGLAAEPPKYATQPTADAPADREAQGGIKFAAKPTFYSALSKAVDETKQNAASGEQWFKYLSSRQGVKADEIRWTGLDDFLKSKPKVTKQEVQDFLRENSVEVKEVTLGAGKKHLTEEEIDAEASAAARRDGRDPDTMSGTEFARYLNDVIWRSETRGPAKFGQYTLPGGENYRELLLTLPQKIGPTPSKQYDAYVKKLDKKYGEEWSSGNIETAEREKLNDLWNRSQTPWLNEGERGPTFRSSHYDEPNILAHVRFNERTSADGKRVLFVEEIQSDWAQKGRREGFAPTRDALERAELAQRQLSERFSQKYGEDWGPSLTPDEVAQWRASGDALKAAGYGRTAAPPSAPFVDSTEKWSSLAAKRVVRWAAENGFDEVAWTTGEQQAARYDLSKQLERVRIGKTPKEEGRWDFNAWVKGESASPRISKGNLTTSELADHVGKELADRAIKEGGGDYRGLDLKVGGEGMKGYYDKILPSVFEKIGKKFGAKVGETSIPQKPSIPFEEWWGRTHVGDVPLEGSTVDRVARREYAKEYGAGSDQPTNVHSLSITPEMRRSVMEEGQPLFATKKGVSEASDKEAFFARAQKNWSQVPGIRRIGDALAFRSPSGKPILIRRSGEIEFDPASLKKGHGEKTAKAVEQGTEQVVGRTYQTKAAIIAEAVETGTLDHEVGGHVAKDYFATARERAAIEADPELNRRAKESGRKVDEEWADWVADYLQKRREGPIEAKSVLHRVAERLYQFFQRVYDTFKPSKEGFARGVKSGRVFERSEKAGVPRVAEQYATAPKTPPDVSQFKAKPIPPEKEFAPEEKVREASRAEETFAQKMDRLWANKLNRVGIIQEHVRKAGGNITSDVKDAYEAVGPKAAARLEAVQKEYVDPLVKTLGKDKLSLKDLDSYVYAKHVLEDKVNEHLKSLDPEGRDNLSGMSDAEAQKILSDLGPKRLKLERAAGYVRGMREKAIDVMLEGGLISKDSKDANGGLIKGQATLWREKYPNYVPLRTMEPDAPFGTGQGFDIRGPESKGRLGRTSRADSPVTFMQEQLSKAIYRAEKNKADQKFLHFVKANKLFAVDKEHSKRALDPKTGQVRQERDVLRDQQDFSLKVNGEKVRIDIESEDPILHRALTNMSAKEMGGFVEKIGNLTRLYSRLVTTWSPEFPFTNFTRDVQTILANAGVEQGAGVAKNTGKNLPKAVKAIWKISRDYKAKGEWEQMAREFKEDGGAVGWVSFNEVPELERRLSRKIEHAGPGAINTAYRSLSSVGNLIESANASVESGARLAFYKALRDSGVSREKAGSLARKISVDFTQKGELGPAFNALYAFFNANVQGAKRMGQVMTTKRGAALAAGIAGVGFAMDQANRAYSEDKNKDGLNDYDAIPEYVKERNLVFMHENGKATLVPMPYGYNVIHTLGRKMSETISGTTAPGRAAVDVGSSLVNAFNPLGSESDLVQTLSPTFLDPLVQHVMNRDFTGKPIRPEGYPGTPKKPDSETYFRNVSPVSREIAKGLNKATGGDKVTPGYIDVSPETIDHFTQFLTGGPGKFSLNLVTTGEALAKGEAPSLAKLPFARRFVYEERQGATNQRYHQNAEDLDTLWMRYETYKKERDNEGLRSLDRNLLRAKQQVDVIDRRIRALRRVAKARPEVEAQIEQLQTRANKIVAEARKRSHLPVNP